MDDGAEGRARVAEVEHTRHRALIWTLAASACIWGGALLALTR